MWRPVSIAATLIVLSGCFQGCGPTGPIECGKFQPTQATLSGASEISVSDMWAVGTKALDFLIMRG